MEQNKRLTLDIQFFADHSDDQNLDDVEEEEEFDEDDFEEEGQEESNEEPEEKESKEQPKEKEENQNDPKKTQTREENSKYAKMRKEQEKLQKEQERLKEQGKLEGIKIAYGGVNKFTNKELKDEHDIKVFMTQLEMEAKGLDPIEDYPEYVANAERTKASEIESEQKKQKWYDEDWKDFKKEYPDVSLKDLNNDARFNKFAKGKIGKMPLKEIYADYNEFLDEFDTEADKKARRAVARAKASPHQSDQNNGDDDKQYMSREELEKLGTQDIVRLSKTDPKKYKQIMDSYEKLKRK